MFCLRDFSCIHWRGEGGKRREGGREGGKRREREGGRGERGKRREGGREGRRKEE